MATGKKLVSDLIDNDNYYLYRHIRLDKNEPFYIGIGTKEYGLRKDRYDRAYNKSRRTKWWKKIINKTGYEVQILMESDDYEFIKQKEIEFIALYGRKNLGKGSLVNLTDGGEGTIGYVVSIGARKKISENSWYRGKFGKNHPNSKRIYQYDLNGNFIKEWDSLADVGREFNPITKRIPNFKQSRFKGFIWKYKFEGVKIEGINYIDGIRRRVEAVETPIYQYDLNGKFLKKFKSLTIAANSVDGSISGLGSCLTRKNKRYLDWFWYTEYLGEHVFINEKLNTKIDQYDLNDNFLKTYNKSIDIIKEYNLGKHAYRDIKNACLNNNKTAFNFKWKYNNEYATATY